MLLNYLTIVEPRRKCLKSLYWSITKEWTHTWDRTTEKERTESVSLRTIRRPFWKPARWRGWAATHRPVLDSLVNSAAERRGHSEVMRDYTLERFPKLLQKRCRTWSRRWKSSTRDPPDDCEIFRRQRCIITQAGAHCAVFTTLAVDQVANVVFQVTAVRHPGFSKYLPLFPHFMAGFSSKNGVP
jgi:hypothetical protein